MASPAQFANRMRKLGRIVEANSSRLVQKASTAILETVVTATPVDEGDAKSNWQTKIDEPASDILPSMDLTGAAAISNGKNVIAGYDGTKNSVVHITNNLPYIGLLNRGSSQQAPAAFVEMAVSAGAAAVSGTKVLK
jgi:hypothetical protein